MSLLDIQILLLIQKILALLDENFKEVETLENQIGWVLLDKTPFYATSGGQNGDIGAIEFEGKKCSSTLRLQNFIILTYQR